MAWIGFCIDTWTPVRSLYNNGNKKTGIFSVVIDKSLNG